VRDAALHTEECSQGKPPCDKARRGWGVGQLADPEWRESQWDQEIGWRMEKRESNKQKNIVSLII
jgi:hypothetical protein